MMIRKKDCFSLSRLMMSVFTVLLLLSASLDTCHSADLVVVAGTTVSLSGDQTFDNVVIESLGKLVFNGPMQFTCERLSLAGTIVISGNTAIEVTYGKTHPNSNEWAMRLPYDELVAYPQNPRIMVDYSSKAEDGAPGMPGSPGVNGYELTITVHGNFHFESKATGQKSFYVEINGQQGGDGGNAFEGSKGQDSGQGGNGGHLRVKIYGNIVAQPSCVLRWKVNGGEGGDYGGGDTIDTTGGGGGSLGMGGSGGTIELSAYSIDPNILGLLYANGGTSGFKAGDAYNGDPPGITTPGAPGGQITIRTESDLVPFLLFLYTDGGDGGMCGSNAGGYYDQLHNWTGQGGNGGRITIETAALDNVTLYSRGGAGGKGLDAINRVCSWDGTSCLWSAIGNGGDGASAGNGGIVTVRAKSVGDGVTYVLNGGEGGKGGRGGRPGCSGAHKECCDVCPSGLDAFDGVNGSPGSFGINRKGGFLLYLPAIIGNAK